MKKYLFYILGIFISSSAIAQTKGFSAKKVAELYTNLNLLYDNFYMLNEYENDDTLHYAELESMFNSMQIIRQYSMKLSNLELELLPKYMPRNKIVSLSQFQKVKERPMKFTPYELKYSEKLDSFTRYYSSISYTISQWPHDSLMAVEFLLTTSSGAEVVGERRSKGRKKLLRIVSIFESEKLLLIIYNVFHSLTENFLRSELLLK